MRCTSFLVLVITPVLPSLEDFNDKRPNLNKTPYLHCPPLSPFEGGWVLGELERDSNGASCNEDPLNQKSFKTVTTRCTSFSVAA